MEWIPAPVRTPKQSEQQSFRNRGTVVGIILLAMLCARELINLVNLVLVAFGILKQHLPLYGLSNTAYCLLQMLWYVVRIPVPALAVALLTRNAPSPFPVKRTPITDLFAMVFVGMAFAVFANIVTSWLMTILGSIGIPTPSFPETMEPTTTSLWLNIISTALFPAFAEEIVFRSYVQGCLAPCGTTASVVVSAALFALFHGNILQVPFAFLMGLILGWLFARTGSILPSVVLHFGNNLMAVLIDYLSVKYPDLQGGAVMLAFSTAVLLGVVGLAALLTRKNSAVFTTGGNGWSRLSVTNRVAASFSSPFLLFAVVWLVTRLVVSVQ